MPQTITSTGIRRCHLACLLGHHKNFRECSAYTCKQLRSNHGRNKVALPSKTNCISYMFCGSGAYFFALHSKLAVKKWCLFWCEHCDLEMKDAQPNNVTKSCGFDLLKRNGTVELQHCSLKTQQYHYQLIQHARLVTKWHCLLTLIFKILLKAYVDFLRRIE